MPAPFLTVSAEGLQVDFLHVAPDKLEAEEHKGGGADHGFHPRPRPGADLTPETEATGATGRRTHNSSKTLNKNVRRKWGSANSRNSC